MTAQVSNLQMLCSNEACGYHRVLRVARTIADLAGVDAVNRTHVAEALGYRRIHHAG